MKSQSTKILSWILPTAMLLLGVLSVVYGGQLKAIYHFLNWFIFGLGGLAYLAIILLIASGNPPYQLKEDDCTLAGKVFVWTVKIFQSCLFLAFSWWWLFVAFWVLFLVGQCVNNALYKGNVTKQ